MMKKYISFFLSVFGFLFLPLALWAQDTNTGQAQTIVQSALKQIGQTVFYDGSYQTLAYPGGDVPRDRGVCTDVIIRAFRGAGVDLQELVHQDMSAAFDAYPKKWGLSKPDRNIDHRRVPNLMTFFERKGKEQVISTKPSDYLAGDVVAWRLANGLLHIGIVSDKKSNDRLRWLIVHNIGNGAKLEDILFSYDIIGHYRYFNRG